MSGRAGGAPKGLFRWYGLQTTDAAAQAFYASVAGWRPLNLGPQTNGYVLFGASRGAIAGMTLGAGGHEGPPRWNGYVAVDDVDETLERVKAAGGSVRHIPVNVPGVLRFSEIADPQGARFIVYRGLGVDNTPWGAADEPGYFGWHELWARDPAGVFDFYSALFGWTRTGAVEMGPMGAYQLWTDGRGFDVGAVTALPDGAPTPLWNYYVQVDGIDAAVERIRAAGGAITDNGPRQAPTGDWIVQGTDPQGAAFSLRSRTR
jgi:hypothetical protein